MIASSSPVLSGVCGPGVVRLVYGDGGVGAGEGGEAWDGDDPIRGRFGSRSGRLSGPGREAFFSGSGLYRALEVATMWFDCVRGNASGVLRSIVSERAFSVLLQPWERRSWYSQNRRTLQQST